MTIGTDTDLSINRRTLLKASGATAIGLTAFSGTVSATAPDEIRFCGCSKVCVQSSHSYRILYATETDGGYTCSLEPSITETEHTSSDCYTVDPGEKMIIGVLDGNRTLFLNPNTCAQEAIDELGDLNDCAGCTENDGTSGDCISTVRSVEDDYTQEGEHEYTAVSVGEDGPVTVTIRTNCCPPCESGEELLVKYEWNGGKFVTEGSNGNIELTSWTLDEDGEPVEACFFTDYCEVDAVVKAGQGYETYVDESGAFCVTGITTENPQGKEITKAISNVQFFCETPDDPSVGNSSGKSGNSSGRP